MFAKAERFPKCSFVNLKTENVGLDNLSVHKLLFNVIISWSALKLYILFGLLLNKLSNNHHLTSQKQPTQKIDIKSNKLKPSKLNA